MTVCLCTLCYMRTMEHSWFNPLYTVLYDDNNNHMIWPNVSTPSGHSDSFTNVRFCPLFLISAVLVSVDKKFNTIAIYVINAFVFKTTGEHAIFANAIFRKSKLYSISAPSSRLRDKLPMSVYSFNRFLIP